MVKIISEEQVKEVMEELKKAGEMINNVGKVVLLDCMGINGWAYLRTDESRSREFRFWAYHNPICIGTQVFLE